MAKAVTEYRLLICHKSNVLMQAALAKWMASGGFERHLRRTTRVNLQRRDHAVSVLNKYDCFEFDIPDGGMALWVKLKHGSGIIEGEASAELLTKKCQQMGIYIQHERQYQLNKDSARDCFIRLGFAGMNENKFADGIDLLVNCLKTKS